MGPHSIYLLKEAVNIVLLSAFVAIALREFLWANYCQKAKTGNILKNATATALFLFVLLPAAMGLWETRDDPFYFFRNRGLYAAFLFDHFYSFPVLSPILVFLGLVYATVKFQRYSRRKQGKLRSSGERRGGGVGLVL